MVVASRSSWRSRSTPFTELSQPRFSESSPAAGPAPRDCRRSEKSSLVRRATHSLPRVARLLFPRRPEAGVASADRARRREGQHQRPRAEFGRRRTPPGCASPGSAAARRSPHSRRRTPPRVAMTVASTEAPSPSDVTQLEQPAEDHRRNRKQERVPGRGDAVEVAKQPGRDRGARARNAGNQGQGLGEADEHPVAHVQLGEVVQAAELAHPGERREQHEARGRALERELQRDGAAERLAEIDDARGDPPPAARAGSRAPRGRRGMCPPRWACRCCGRSRGSRTAARRILRPSIARREARGRRCCRRCRGRAGGGRAALSGRRSTTRVAAHRRRPRIADRGRRAPPARGVARSAREGK